MLQVKLADIKKVVVEEVPELAPPKEDWATIDVQAVGLCGSEMHVYVGENPVLSPPLIQGHEFSGTIKALGSESKLSIGQRVTVNPVVACGECFHCKGGNRYLCDDAYVIGGQVDGGLAGEVYVPIRNIVPIQDSTSFRQATIIEPAAVAVHTVGDIQGTVLIIGQGAIGLLCQQVAKAKGCKVIATDINDFSLDISRQLGSDKVINTKMQDAVKEIQEFLGDQPLDAVIDAVGTPATMNLAIDRVKKGGRIVLVGIPPKDFQFHLVDMLIKEVHLFSSYLYTEEEFVEARDLIESGKINVDPMITKVFPFAEGSQAYAYKHEEPSIKVIIEK